MWVGSCARAPQAVYLMAAATFPCLGDARRAGSASGLLTSRGSSGEGDALVPVPLPSLSASSPCGAPGCDSAGDPAVVRTSAVHVSPWRHPGPASGRGHPDPNRGAELVSHGGPSAVASQSQHEATPEPRVRLPGTAAAREQDAGVWGTPIRRVQGPHLWRSRRLAGDDKPHGPRNTRPALSSCNGPRPQLRHGPNLAVLLPVPVARCCTLVWMYLLEWLLLRRAGTRRD